MGRRTVPLGAVGLLALAVLAGCGGPPAVDGEIRVANATDTDCDGAAAGFAVSVSVRSTEPLPDDAYVDVDYRKRNGNFERYRRFEAVGGTEFERRLDVSVADLSAGDSTRMRVEVRRDGFLSDGTLASAVTGNVSVESPDADAAKLEPVFETDPRPPKLTEPAVLTAADAAEGGCGIVAYRWDVDGDGRVDRRGRNVTHEFATDGRRPVTLSVETERGVVANATRSLLVVHDPDGDGLTTSRERELGTDPNAADTDADLFHDGVDPAPTAVLVPTGLLQVGLGVACYGLVLFGWDRVVALWLAIRSRI